MSGFESQNAAERQVVEFFHGYRALFESFDAERIADCYAFPFQLIGDADEVSAISLAGRETWIPIIKGLLAAYRTIGVASAYPVEIRVTLMSPNVLMARVHWRLLRPDQSTVYQFHANYTMVLAGGALRISAIVHDESPRLRAAVAQAKSGSGK